MTSLVALVRPTTSGSQNVCEATIKQTSFRVDRRLKFTSPHTHFSSQSAFELHSDQTYKFSVAQPTFELFIHQQVSSVFTKCKTIIAIKNGFEQTFDSQIGRAGELQLISFDRSWQSGVFIGNQRYAIKIIFKIIFTARNDLITRKLYNFNHNRITRRASPSHKVKQFSFRLRPTTHNKRRESRH